MMIFTDLYRICQVVCRMLVDGINNKKGYHIAVISNLNNYHIIFYLPSAKPPGCVLPTKKISGNLPFAKSEQSIPKP